MSRTYRRQQPHLRNANLGTRSDEARDPWWLMYRYPTLTFDQAYDRALARFHRDHHRGHFNAPRDFRRRWGSKLIRCRETQKLHRHLRRDEWDDHLSEHRARDANWRWF